MPDTNSALDDNNLRWIKKAKSTISCTGIIAKDSPTFDGNVQEKSKNENPFKHFNMHQNTLKGFDDKYTNSLLTNLKSVNNVPQWSNHNQLIEPLVVNGTRYHENIFDSTTDTWKESISVEKIRLTMLKYMSSLTGKMIPLINLHAIANPFVQITAEECQSANNVNVDIAEILCRKRTETAVIIWIVNKLNQ